MPALFPGIQASLLKIDQGAAGSTDLVAAPTGTRERIFVVSVVLMMAAAGTAKFTEGTSPTDITGALPIAINAGFVASGTPETPILWTPTANSKLSLVTATGAAKGWIIYYTSSSTP